MPTPYTVCCVTVDDKAAARTLAKGLVCGGIAACVSVVPNISSTYRWMNRLEKAEESLLIIKTRKTLKEPLRRFVTDNHPAKVPEVIFLDISGGSAPYLKWLGENTRPPRAARRKRGKDAGKRTGR